MPYKIGSDRQHFFKQRCGAESKRGKDPSGLPRDAISPLVPLQLDIVQWVEARLVAFNAQLPAGGAMSTLALEGVTTRQLWIDGERLGVAITFCQPESAKDFLRLTLRSVEMAKGLVEALLDALEYRQLTPFQSIAGIRRETPEVKLSYAVTSKRIGSPRPHTIKLAWSVRALCLRLCLSSSWTSIKENA
ncbi:MAG: hypothetical protein ACRERW_01425 [Pseudomonas sp.]